MTLFIGLFHNTQIKPTGSDPSFEYEYFGTGIQDASQLASGP